MDLIFINLPRKMSIKFSKQSPVWSVMHMLFEQTPV